MRKCPACDKWTLDFDDYFGRFRCFNVDCGWIQNSSLELERHLAEAPEKSNRFTPRTVPELGLNIQTWYDKENDALSVDFGLDEPSFDLPDCDGRILWQIGRETGSVVGFAILLARRSGISLIVVDIAARKEDIERGLSRMGSALSAGRATRTLVERVVIRTEQGEARRRRPDPRMARVFKQLLNDFQSWVGNQVAT